MESQLSLTALQTELFWEDKKKNFHHLERQIEQLPATDVIILPEMFTTGFTMEAEKFAENMDGKTVQWLKELAYKKQAAIGGSTIIKENNNIFNRFLLVSPSGKIQHYDKRHTFTLAGENKAYTTGKNNGIVTYKDWKICLRVCYDLRFPVWGRNTSDYDLLIYTANWPHKRIAAWDTLLKARAIENMTYCVGVNRIGTDGSNLTYPGHTTVFNHMGDCIGETTEHKPGSTTILLDKDAMLLARKKLDFLNDRDQFTLH